MPRTISKKVVLQKASLAESSDVFEESMAPSAALRSASRQNASGKYPNEDRAFSSLQSYWTETGEELNFCFAGVADGHGGSSASELVKTAVSELLTSAMISASGNIPSAVAETFHKLEESCLALSDQAGTCVCACLVGAGKVWCANLGDCRAVLYGFEGETCLLSIDQRASDGPEYDRIVRAGGAVIDDAVEGLMQSRSLGDADVKACCPPGVVLAQPELRVFEGRGLIVVGTDGLWDFLGVEDVAALLPPPGKPRRRAADDTDILQAIADRLVKVAVDRGSEDDVTAIVIPVL